MTGPEHYQAAERLLAVSLNTPQEDDDQPRLVWTANVHATLALAASHALMGEATDPGWWDVAAPSTFVPKEVTR
jgi:hypothetical protein